jgi:hypothetical protein
MCSRMRLSSDVSEIQLVFGIPPERPIPNSAKLERGAQRLPAHRSLLRQDRGGAASTCWFEAFPLPDNYAGVRQLAGRKGEVWGPNPRPISCS